MGGSAGSGSSAEAPTIEWPPPAPSVAAAFEPSFFAQDHTLAEAANRIEAMLRRHGYSDLRWYVTDSGFVVATRCESIDDHGAPLTPRFSTDVPNTLEFSIRGVLRALFKPKKGRFRVILVTLTSQPDSVNTRAPAASDAAEVERFGRFGGLSIPDELTSQPLSGHSGFVLFYEISRIADSEPKLVYDSALPSDVELRTSGLELR